MGKGGFSSLGKGGIRVPWTRSARHSKTAVRPTEMGYPCLGKGVPPSLGNGVRGHRKRGARCAAKGYPPLVKGVLPVPPKTGCPPPRTNGPPSPGQRERGLGELVSRPSEREPVPRKRAPVPRKRAPVLQNTGSRPSVMAYPSLGNGGTVPRKNEVPLPRIKGSPPRGKGTRYSEKGAPPILNWVYPPSEKLVSLPQEKGCHSLETRAPVTRKRRAGRPPEGYPSIRRGYPSLGNGVPPALGKGRTRPPKTATRRWYKGTRPSLRATRSPVNGMIAPREKATRPSRKGLYTLPSVKAYPSLGKRGMRNGDKGTRASEKGVPVPAERSSDIRNRATGLRRNGCTTRGNG